MADELKGKRVAIVATDGVEQIEMTEPRKAVEQAGATVELLSPQTGEFQGMEGDINKKDTFTADKAVKNASADDYDGLIVPGGCVGADNLRADEDVVSLVRSFVEAGKPTSVICHGPWVLIEADVVRGRRVTSYPSLQTDIRNAGGEWVDDEVVVDGNLVTSRNPDDLPAFCAKTVELLS